MAFSPSLTVASRLLHPYSTGAKRPRLIVKQSSTARDSEREPQSYTENRRGRRKIEVTRRRRGEVERRESNLASNQFPKCFPQPGIPRGIHRVKQIREGGGRR